MTTVPKVRHTILIFQYLTPSAGPPEISPLLLSCHGHRDQRDGSPLPWLPSLQRGRINELKSQKKRPFSFEIIFT